MPIRYLLIHAFGEDPVALSTALRVARNTIRELGANTGIHIVVQGPLVRQLSAGSSFANEIIETHAAGPIEIAACHNSMASAGVDAAALNPVIEVVPSAVAYLAERQWEGWAYVRV